MRIRKEDNKIKIILNRGVTKKYLIKCYDNIHARV